MRVWPLKLERKSLTAEEDCDLRQAEDRIETLEAEVEYHDDAISKTWSKLQESAGDVAALKLRGGNEESDTLGELDFVFQNLEKLSHSESQVLLRGCCRVARFKEAEAAHRAELASFELSWRSKSA